MGDIKKFCRNLYDVINETEELKIVSIIIDGDSLLIELQDGSKYRLIIQPTDEFV